MVAPSAPPGLRRRGRGRRGPRSARRTSGGPARHRCPSRRSRGGDRPARPRQGGVRAAPREGGREVVGVLVPAEPASAIGLVRPLGAERARAGEAVPDRRPHGVCRAGQRPGVKAELTRVDEQPGGGVPEQELRGQEIWHGCRIVRRILLAGEEPELGVDRQCPPGLGEHLPPAGSTRRRLGPRPGHVPVVEQLEHRVELLVGLERPVLPARLPNGRRTPRPPDRVATVGTVNGSPGHVATGVAGG